MLKTRPTRLPSICLSCRLRLQQSASRPSNKVAASAIHARAASSKPANTYSTTSKRRFGSSTRKFNEEQPSNISRKETELSPSLQQTETLSPVELKAAQHNRNEAIARRARQAFGDSLPPDFLSEEQQKIYERLYGPAIIAAEEDALEEPTPTNDALFRLREDGEYEEIEFVRMAEGEQEEDLVKHRSEIQTGSRQEEETIDREARKPLQASEEAEKNEVEEEAVEEEFDEDIDQDEEYERAHPLTVAGRWATSPSTIFLPKTSLTDHTTALLAQKANKHLIETAHRVFGGRFLPHSSTTAPAGTNTEQKPIALNATQSNMADMEADVYLAAVMPGTYAAVLAVVTEVRRRLGSEWIESLLKQKEGPRVLDAGAGGAAVVAWREVLRAEWARMQERESGSENTHIAGEGTEQPAPPPLGKATVVTGSDALRYRASRLLDDTVFLPRLPDTVTDEVQGGKKRNLYDIIIAPHTLWHLKEDYLRKQCVQTLWSLLNPNGGVLILLEKGLPRGFEVIAGARQLLLDKHISSPSAETFERSLGKLSADDEATAEGRYVKKETGMIIAPCTNHTQCPMYLTPGVNKNRKDFCYFKQRYIRPPYLQHMLGAKDRNHEDVQFSYLAVRRGKDERINSETQEEVIPQGDSATDAAFAGYEYEEASGSETETSSKQPSTLTFPRLVLQPLKRHGHIILDVCTPSGQIERWTVPRSFSKQAFRDARKARWGDLWGLGAKTRVARRIRLGKKEDWDKKTTEKMEKMRERQAMKAADVRDEKRMRGEKGRTKGKRRRLEERARLMGGE